LDPAELESVRDVSHDLAEQLASAVARDRFAAEGRVVVGGLERTHDDSLA
jgi:hypothetical protein